MCDEQYGEEDPNVIEWIKEHRKDKVNYDATCRFQDNWAAKLNWAECVKGGNGLYDFVRCIVCTEFETREKILQPKWDTLKKHGGKRKAKKTIPSKGIRIGQWYIATNCKHFINDKRWVARIVQKPMTSLNTSIAFKSQHFYTVDTFPYDEVYDSWR